MAGIERAKLPDLRCAVDILGPLTADAAMHLGVEPGAPVVVGSSDIHSAAVGAGAVRNYDANLYVVLVRSQPCVGRSSPMCWDARSIRQPIRLWQMCAERR
ncbi:MAG: hypothetical protein ACUVWS_08230 [Roseiflexus sp.]